MKTINLFIFSVIIFLLCSCSQNNTEENPPLTNRQQTTIVSGKWYIQEFSEAFGVVQNFTANQVIWEFKPNEVLDVTVNTTILQGLSMPYQQTGTGTYLLTNQKVKIKNFDYEITVVDDKTLKLDAGSTFDLPIIILKKVTN